MSHYYYKLYKPYRVVSQFITNDAKARKKQFLGDFLPKVEGLMAVGRLDETSEGLLLVTTNGNYSNHINKGGTEKEYYVQLDGDIDEVSLNKLQNGVEISVNKKMYVTKKCVVHKIEIPNIPPTKQRIRDERHGPTSWISITITEGKFRQVRKMTAAVGFPTLRLVRYRVGNYTIENMDSGSYEDIKVEAAH